MLPGHADHAVNHAALAPRRELPARLAELVLFRTEVGGGEGRHDLPSILRPLVAQLLDWLGWRRVLRLGVLASGWQCLGLRIGWRRNHAGGRSWRWIVSNDLRGTNRNRAPVSLGLFRPDAVVALARAAIPRPRSILRVAVLLGLANHDGA